MADEKDNIEQISEHPDYVANAADPVAQVAFGVHVVMMNDGGFTMQATGTPNLGEMHMILVRAVASIEARMVAETVLHLQQEMANSKRIITPGR